VGHAQLAQAAMNPSKPAESADGRGRRVVNSSCGGFLLSPGGRAREESAAFISRATVPGAVRPMACRPPHLHLARI
jgi:hypothetical protein